MIAITAISSINAQVHFTFNSSRDDMGVTVFDAESPNNQTISLMENQGENNTETGNMSSGIVTDPVRGQVLQIANRYEFAEASTLPTTGDWSMSYWFKLDSSAGGYTAYNLVFYAESTNAMVSIINATWNAGASTIYMNKISGITADQGPALADGVWNHFVTAFDESENEITTYRNGVFLETQSFGNTYPFAFQNYNKWVIGADWGGSAISKYDDFMIHNSVLDQAAVTALYNSQTLSTNNNVAFASNIKLYPNPAKSTFKIETTNDATISNIAIFDLLGKKAATLIPTKNKNEYNIDNLSNGLYIVKISNQLGNTITKRLVKK